MTASIRLALLLLLCAPLASRAGDEAKWRYPAPPSIRSVTLGSPLSLVLKEMGQPLQRIALPPSEMGRPASQDLVYDGFTLGVYPTRQGDEPHVWSVRVTGTGVVVYPGVTIGMTKEELVHLLGKPNSDEAREDAQWMFWAVPEPVGMFHVRLSNGRIIEFSMLEDWS